MSKSAIRAKLLTIDDKRNEVCKRMVRALPDDMEAYNGCKEEMKGLNSLWMRTWEEARKQGMTWKECTSDLRKEAREFAGC